MSEPSNDRLLQDEDEFQYFGFSSTQLLDETKCLAVDQIDNLVSDFYTKAKQFKGDDKQLVEEMRNLRNIYLNKFNLHLPNLERVFRKIMNIPPDSVPRLNLDEEVDEELNQLRAETEALEEEYLREEMFAALCKEELKHFEEVEPLIKQTKATLETLSKVNNENQEAVKLPGQLNKLVEQFEDDSVKVLEGEF